LDTSKISSIPSFEVEILIALSTNQEVGQTGAKKEVRKAQVLTSVTAHLLVFRLLLEKKKKKK
jgi:hypothetical protein